MADRKRHAELDGIDRAGVGCRVLSGRWGKKVTGLKKGGYAMGGSLGRSGGRSGGLGCEGRIYSVASHLQ